MGKDSEADQDSVSDHVNFIRQGSRGGQGGYPDNWGGVRLPRQRGGRLQVGALV